MKICELCGTAYEGRAYKYCSDECRRKVHCLHSMKFKRFSTNSKCRAWAKGVARHIIEEELYFDLNRLSEYIFSNCKRKKVD